jgi:uncharacterized DUF497 family protein
MKRRPPRRLRGIIYLPEYRTKNWQKHCVSEDEVLELLGGLVLFQFRKRGLHRREDIYAAYGSTSTGRRLIAFFVHKASGQALILSVRDMTKSERKYYDTHKARRIHQGGT